MDYSSVMPLITPDNAREMQTLAQAALREKRKAKAEATPQKTDQHTHRRMVRVRQQLRRIDELLLTETDPLRLSQLSLASSRLEEQERRLSGRKLPATARSGPERSRPAWTAPPAPKPSVSEPPTTGSVQPSNQPPKIEPPA